MHLTKDFARGMNVDLPDKTRMNEAQTPCSPDEVHTDFCFPNKLSRMTQHLHVPGEELRLKKICLF